MNVDKGSGGVRRSGRRGIDDAVLYCLEGWFPVNGKYLTYVGEQFKKGVYEDKRKLLADLRADVSLLTYCFRRISDASGTTRLQEDPIQTLLGLSNEDLRDLLTVSERDISTHSLRDLPTSQACRLRHSLISASTAELLAEKSGEDASMTLSCASLQQLGLNLIAFNYPSIYTRALQTQAEGGQTVDEALDVLLGFTSEQLTLRIMEEWRFGPTLQKLLVEEPSDLDSVSQKLIRFCEIGDVVARLNDPQYHPRAKQDWAAVASDIEKMLGPDGVDIINKRIEGVSAAYSTLQGKSFVGQILPEKSIELASERYASQLLEKNTFLQRCPEEMHDGFREAYRYMRYRQVSGESMIILAMKAIPNMGFSRGCIYLLDQKNMTLVPKLRIGDAPKEHFQPISCSLAPNGASAIVEALYSTIPLRGEGFFQNQSISHLSWSIGEDGRQGVLHLQMAPSLRDHPTHQPLLFFKACRHAINDALNFQS